MKVNDLLSIEIICTDAIEAECNSIETVFMILKRWEKRPYLKTLFQLWASCGLHSYRPKWAVQGLFRLAIIEKKMAHLRSKKMDRIRKGKYVNKSTMSELSRRGRTAGQ